MESLLRAAGMRGLQDILASFDQPLLPMLQKVGIPEQALRDEDLRISLLAYSRLMEELAQLINRDDLGLLMAEHQNIGILGPLAIAMQNAATLREAMKVCSGHLHTHSPGIRLRIKVDSPEPGLTTLQLHLLIPGWLEQRQVMEQCLADLHHFMLWLAGDELHFAYCELPHSALSNQRRYQQVFNCELRFKSAQAALVLEDGLMDLSLAGASEQLHRLSLDYLRIAFEPGHGSLREQVESILERALSSTRGRREVVASLLQIHPRTMQRRLAAEGCNFQQLVDQTRMHKAKYWLTTTDMPLSQIPGQLGLADQTVLNRSCRRWFGQSPGALRAGLNSPC